MEYITVECMNMNPHKAHSWREGFLWHRKRECKGVPKYVLHNWPREPLVNNYCEADVEMTSALFKRLYHRHKFQLHDDSTNAYLVWYCKDCPKATRFAQSRYVYVRQTIYGREFDALPWEL